VDGCGVPWRGTAAVTSGARNQRSEVTYSESMKARMIKRLTGPNAMSAAALSRETGISEASLSRWLNAAGTVAEMSKKTRQLRRNPSRRAEDWTAEEKLAVVMEAAALPEDELGAFVRRKGLHLEQLKQWRELVLDGAAGALESPTRRKSAKRGPTPEQKRIRELERQLHRKEKALAEAAALLVLKKKHEALFGDEEDDTSPRSGG
jgi:transposase-like protein